MNFLAVEKIIVYRSITEQNADEFWNYIISEYPGYFLLSMGLILGFCVFIHWYTNKKRR